MRLRFRPVETTFYDLFAEMAQQLVAGSDLLAALLDPQSDKVELAKQMSDAEHAADEMTHTIVRRANQTFITPFDREDIYKLASSLDDVMDHMEEVVDFYTVYEIEELPKQVAKQIEVLQRACQVTADAMPRLRTMKDLEEYWIEINRLENQGDKSYRRILADLFSGSYKTLQVMKLKDVVDSLEHAIDALESVANTVEQIAVKES